MRTIFAEYNPQCNSIDVYTSAGYMLRIDCWEAEKNLKTTPSSDLYYKHVDTLCMYPHAYFYYNKRRIRLVRWDIAPVF